MRLHITAMRSTEFILKRCIDYYSYKQTEVVKTTRLGENVTYFHFDFAFTRRD